MIEDPYLGKYTACVSARSTDREILKKSQDGGIATTLMVYALEQGIIDGAIVTGKGDRPWEPKPFVAMSREDILKARGGTIYNISPPQISWLKEATRSYGLDRVGVTGVCCQMQAVRKAQLYPMNMRDVPEKIGLAIGLFCMENFSYKSMQTIVEDHAAQSLGSVKKMEITKGKFWVYTDRGNVATVPPLKDTHKYEQPGCHVCLDYVSNLGDISTGSVGSRKAGLRSLSAPERVMKSGLEQSMRDCSRRSPSRMSSQVSISSGSLRRKRSTRTARPSRSAGISALIRR